MQPTVTVLGSGYVGLTAAAMLAAAGIKTYIVDPNDERLKAIRQGRSFFYEAGLDPLIADAIESGMLLPTQSYKDSVANSSIVFSAVGTPDNPDGSSNLSYVFAAAEEALQHLPKKAVYVQKSTVPVGTGQKITAMFSKDRQDIRYVSNPEFLREGCALQDSLWFDRVVVGGDDPEALQQVINLYKTIHKARPRLEKLSGVTAPKQPKAEQYITTTLPSAELIKVTANAFLSLKISFANSIAKLADKAGADINEVMQAVGADTRINPAFFNAGRGYGGGCFPKDVSGLIAAGLEHGVALPILEASQAVNDSMPGYIIEKLQLELDDSIEGKRIAVLGLAFKADTSDVRRSPGIAIANFLVSEGSQVQAYDPQAHEEAKHDLSPEVTLADTLEQALDGCQAVIVATDWHQFRQLPAKTYAKHLKKGIFVDAMNCFNSSQIQQAGMRYIGVGRS